MINLSYGIRMSAELSFVLSLYTRVTDRQTDRRTDRRTDGFTIAHTALHSMQRSKNSMALTYYRDLATSGVDAGTSMRFPATARCEVSCLHSGRLSERSRDSAGARPFHRQLSHGISDRSADSAPELRLENAIYDLCLQRISIR